MPDLGMADPGLLGYVGRSPLSERASNDWYTPAIYIDAARLALGGKIDLDPYSSEAANKTVRAARIYTSADPAPPGCHWPEVETCWINPPYSGQAVLEASRNFVAAFEASRFHQGIALVNNATECRFFQLLLRKATALCLTDHRISFENCDGKRISGNTRGQCFFYFGDREARFLEEFRQFGCCFGLGSR